jgi:hypothetical protein
VQRAIRPARLIRQAHELAGPEQRGQPRNANLRRAVSAAYYALFHHIALATSCHLLPSASETDQYALARCVQHAAVKDVCRWVTAQPPAGLEPSLRSVRAVPELLDVSVSFPLLLDARERADYDHMASFTKAEVLSHVEAAEDSIVKLDGVKSSEREIYLACIALRSSARSR